MFLAVALKRLHYPFELDRMESAMMTTVWRVVHGMPVYVRPSLEWAPFCTRRCSSIALRR